MVLRVRSLAWYGEGDEPAEFVALPPTGYEQYRIGGTLRVVSRERPPVIDTIVITDKDTGAVVTLTGEAGSVDGSAVTPRRRTSRVFGRPRATWPDWCDEVARQRVACESRQS